MTAVVVDLAAFRARKPVDQLSGNVLAAARVPLALVDALRDGGVAESETVTGIIRVKAAGCARTYEQIFAAWMTVMDAKRAGLTVADLHPLVESALWIHEGGRTETILNARLSGVAS